MQILYLPPKTQKLVNHYFNLKIGSRNITCPYYQNLRKKTKYAVFSGKGKPKEIESEIKKLLKVKPGIKNYSQSSKRLALVEADLGVDCSGLVANVLDEFLKETKNISLFKVIPLNAFSFYRRITFKLRPRTNLSAHKLTSPPISVPIKINKLQPGDLFKVGKGHVAIITHVWKKKNTVEKIEYAHSTPDYNNEYGVRTGRIIINHPKQPLEKQKWTETLNGQNYMKDDYLKAKPNQHGFYRLQFLCKNEL
jgi:hypothetical protein